MSVPIGFYNNVLKPIYSTIYSNLLTPIYDKTKEKATYIRQTTGDFKSTISTDHTFRNTYFIQVLTYIIVSIITILLLWHVSIKPINIKTSHFDYPAFILVTSLLFPLLYKFFYATPFPDSNPYNYIKNYLLSAMAILTILTTILYLYYELDKRYPTVGSFLLYIFIGFSIAGAIIFLAIIQYIFSNYLISLNGWSGYISHFIFYIPCLLIEFIQYLLSELRLTTSPVFILLFLEAIVVICFLYLPTLIEKINVTGGIPLLPDAVFLNKETNISNNQIFKVKNPDPNNLLDTNKRDVFRANYSVSLWIYLNPQQMNSTAKDEEINIINFGNGKPRIAYLNDKQVSDLNIDELVIYLSNTNPESSNFKIKIEKQKWNNLVFNYNESGSDLFVNGILTRSIKFNKNNMPTYSPSDSVIVGSNNGIYGSVCNVTYYNAPLSIFQIANLYNLLMFSNPPINTYKK